MPASRAGTGHVAIAAVRVDGRAKVTGAARYAAEHPRRDLAYGVVVTSTIARGRITAIDASRGAGACPACSSPHAREPARRCAWLDMQLQATWTRRPARRSAAPRRRDPLQRPAGGAGGRRDLRGGPPRGVARRASTTTAEPHETDLLAHRERRTPAEPTKAAIEPPPEADAATPKRPSRRRRCRSTRELHHGRRAPQPDGAARDHRGLRTTTARSPSTTRRRASQNSQRLRLQRVRPAEEQACACSTRSSAAPSARGCGRSTSCSWPCWRRCELKRSVRVVLTRQQMFSFGHRPETWQRVALARRSRRHAQAIIHEAVAETSRHRGLRRDGRQLVGPCSTAATTSGSTTSSSPLDLLHADRHARARRGAAACTRSSARWTSWPTRSAMDPLELRLKNYAERDPTSDKPVLEQGAARLLRAGRRAVRLGAARPRAARRCATATSWSAGAWPRGIWDAMQMPARGRGPCCTPTARSTVGSADQPTSAPAPTRS